MPQEEAEWRAKNFVRERVKFFTRNESESRDVPEPELSVVETRAEGDRYFITLGVNAQRGVKVSKKNLSVVVDAGSGKVVEFLGQKLE